MKIPFLNRKEIEKKAQTLLDDFYKSTNSEKNGPIEVMDIAEHLGYNLDFRKDGIYEDRSILGGLIIEDKRIEINANIANQKGRTTFTIAHEIGHIVLHVPLYNKIKDEKAILCRKDEGIYGNKKNPEEVQADMFASHLIMPSDIIEESFKSIYRKPVNVKKFKLINFIFPKSRKQKAMIIAQKVIEQSKLTNVSKLAMMNRLIGLNLIQGIRFQKNRT
tara:strand:- start:814 stop:1470 length:657 start_codon:yes stop_codon:yes gene_type:complete